MNKIKKGNKLIAGFMFDLKTGRLNVSGLFCSAYPKAKSIDDLWDDELEHYLKYDSSWDWLMPVVIKCLTLEIKGHAWSKAERFDSYLYFSDFRNLTYVWEKVIEFIKWYNKTIKE